MVTFLPQAKIDIPNRLLDLTQLNQGIDQLGATFRDNRIRENQAVVGSKLASGDYTGAAQSAGAMGDTKAAMGIKQFSSNQQTAEEERARRMAQKMAGIVQNYIDPIKDPAQRAGAIGKLVTSHPNMLPELQKAGVDIKNPEAVLGYIKAEASQYVQPMDLERHRAEMGRIEAQTAAAKAAASQRQARVLTPEDRAQLAQQYGLRPGSDEYKRFVLTGDMAAPRSANLMNPTVQKELFEAEDMVSANRGVINSLTQAKALSKDAYDGLAASARGYTGSLIGLEGGNKTQELENLITTQALESLRAVFGGNPTEGERKILLDVAGSVGKTDAVRQAIYDRAIDAANNRLAANQAKARALRTGDYFSPSYQQPQSPPRFGPNDKAAYDALPSGSAYIDAEGNPRTKR